MKTNRVIWVAAFLLLLLVVLIPNTLMASSGGVPLIAGIRPEFIVFALTLVGVAIFHDHTMYVALGGLVVLLILKYSMAPGFDFIEHIAGSASEKGEWSTLLNLAGLLFGFAVLANMFEKSNIPEIIPNVLPNDWKGGLVLLALIMVLSSFLDNIAAALIGGTIAQVVFRHKLHIGYLAAIIAASNAGGAGSVVGDTTTTLMWIDGVDPILVVHAFVASIAGFLIYGVIASRQQQKFQPILAHKPEGVKPDFMRLLIVLLILVGAILTNALLNFPALGVWIAILVSVFIRKFPVEAMKKAIPGTIFLVSLVTCASLMPVDELPAASWQTAFSLGFVSSVFDNIPLTKLCLEQGGYDWGILAYTVGFGGSMIWFGSSAGVALSGIFPEIRSVGKYLQKGWHVTLAYIISFFIMLWIVGWHPATPHKPPKASEVESNAGDFATSNSNSQ